MTPFERAGAILITPSGDLRAHRTCEEAVRASQPGDYMIPAPFAVLVPTPFGEGMDSGEVPFGQHWTFESARARASEVAAHGTPATISDSTGKRLAFFAATVFP